MAYAPNPLKFKKTSILRKAALNNKKLL